MKRDELYDTAPSDFLTPEEQAEYAAFLRARGEEDIALPKPLSALLAAVEVTPPSERQRRDREARIIEALEEASESENSLAWLLPSAGWARALVGGVLAAVLAVAVLLLPSGPDATDLESLYAAGSHYSEIYGVNLQEDLAEIVSGSETSEEALHYLVGQLLTEGNEEYLRYVEQSFDLLPDLGATDEERSFLGRQLLEPRG
jgi:hypothetical protein